MRALHLIACLFVLLPSLHAQDELPLFASQGAEVTLTDTEGVSIEAVIHDVWPQRRQARIFVPEQGDSFTLLLDTFNQDSQALLEDWFFKRVANLNLSFEVEERLLGRTQEVKDRGSLPSAPDRAINIRVNDQTRNKDVSVGIRNSSHYDLDALRVTIGLRVARDISYSNSSSRTRLERTVRTVYRNVAVSSSSTVTLDSAPVALSNYSLRYDLLTQVASPHGGLMDDVLRYRAHATDRIIAYYVLVHYKDELVAAAVSQRSLIRQLLDEKREQDNRRQWQSQPDVDVYDEDFVPGRGGKTTFREAFEPRRSTIIVR